jgi:hypothetical protein
MRCKACNKGLTEFESTRKSASTGEFVDLCNECFRYIKDDVYTTENPSLESIQDLMDLTGDEG